jgi:hypothetical protein
MSGTNGAAQAGADQGGRPATPADVRVAGVENLLADYNALAAEKGEEPVNEPAPAPAAAPPAAAKPKEEPKPEKKGREGKKTAQDYALERIAQREQRLAAREQELTAKVADLDAKLAEVGATSPAQLRALVESGKADDLAKTMGFDSWNALNDHFARLYASPEYKRIRDLEQTTARMAREKEERDQRERAAIADREWQETVQAAVAEVGDVLKGSGDEVLALHAEDTDFCAEVTRQILQAGGNPDVEEIARKVASGAEKRYRQWHKVYGDRPASTAETATADPPTRAGSKQPAKPQKHVSRQSATEASNPLPKEFTDAEWKAFATAELRKAWNAEEEEKRREQER